MAYKKVRKNASVKANKAVKAVKVKRINTSKAVQNKIEAQFKKVFLDRSIGIEDEVEVIDVSETTTTDIINTEVIEAEEVEKTSKRSIIEDILFKLPNVSDPIIGTPKQVQEKLDKIAIKIQKNPRSASSQNLFNKIHLYMHGYLINIVLKQFPYIRGMQTADIYQQTLIALWSKAIPNFRNNKGMSFLNFAKMCIRRHLITILNTSKTRQLDLAINQAISLDSYPLNVDEDSHNTYSNIIPSKEEPVDQKTANNEAYAVTRDTLLNVLSDFEKVVLNEYLSTSTYKEIATNISKVNRQRGCIPKSVDNALLRIRKKALSLRENGKIEEIPLFIV